MGAGVVGAAAGAAAGVVFLPKPKKPLFAGAAGAAGGAMVAAGAGVGATAGVAAATPALAYQSLMPLWPLQAPFLVAPVQYEPSLHRPVEPAGVPTGAAISFDLA